MSNLLEDFFISIGWRVDEASYKKQRDLVDRTREQRRRDEREEQERDRAERERERDRARRLEASIVRANLFASAIEGMAKSVVRSVANIASGFEQMFYASQRTNQSVQSLKSMAYAVGQLGGSYDGALQSMEAFARNIRNNPGYESMLGQLGVKTRDASGKLLAENKIVDEFFKKTANMPSYLARDYAADLGIDEGTFTVYRQNREEMQRFQEQSERRAKAFGLDNDKAAKSGKEFMQALRGLQDTGTTLAEKFYSDLAPALTQIIQGFQRWIDTHPEQINAALQLGEKIVLAFAHAVEKIGTFLGPVIVQFGEWAKSINGQDGLQDSLDTFATWLLGAWVVKILAGFARVGTGWAAMLLRLGLPAGVLAGTALLGSELYKGSQTGEALVHGGRPRSGMNPGDELPGVGGSSGGGDGAVARVKKMWRWLTGGGGDSAGKGDYNFTGSNADVLRQAAKELGTSPEDLATVISYESKFRPNVWGGKGGNYLGLIQFGAQERRDFGVNENQTFAEQMPSVVKFLKARGFKPGMGLLDLYSTINAGRPGLYDRSDGNGTVRSHAERMAITERGRVARFLSSGSTPAGAGASPSVDQMTDIARRMDFSSSSVGMPSSGGNTYNNGHTITASPNVNITVNGGGSGNETAGLVARAMERVNQSSVGSIQGALR